VIALIASALVKLTIVSWVTVGICAAGACLHAAIAPDEVRHGRDLGASEQANKAGNSRRSHSRRTERGRS
jgi:hypothetical protein